MEMEIILCFLSEGFRWCLGLMIGPYIEVICEVSHFCQFSYYHSCGLVKVAHLITCFSK